MLHAKKSLGQHFLRDPRILRKIADAAKLTAEDTVLEVGPGEGTLTAFLLEQAGKVIAVEKDARLIPVLRQKFASEIASSKLNLIHADILSLDPSAYGLEPRAYKVVANLPYYITGQFLRAFLETEHQPSDMVLLLQKEVARRIVAKDKRESVLSISVKAYGTPRYVDTVKAGSFIPPPKVDSAILTIENISKEFFKSFEVQPQEGSSRSNLKETAEKQFFELLKKGFAHPRKFLSSNLKITAEELVACGLKATARAEELSLSDWKCVAELYRT